MGILSWIVVSLIAGWLAGLIVKGGGFGCIGDLLVFVCLCLTITYQKISLFLLPLNSKPPEFNVREVSCFF